MRQRIMTDSFSKLFNNLKAEIQEEDMTEGLLLGSEIKRTINTSKEEDMWIKKSKIKSKECLPNRLVFVFTYEDESIIVFPECNTETAFMKNVEKPKEINKGILTVMWSENKNLIKKDENIGSKLAQNIFGRDRRYTLDDWRSNFQRSNS